MNRTKCLRIGSYIVGIAMFLTACTDVSTDSEPDRIVKDFPWPREDFRAIWGESPSNMFVVGSSGTILRNNGEEWEELESGTSLTIRDIWGPLSDNLFAVGEGGMLLRFDGNGWRTEDIGYTTRFNTVWGTSGTNVFIGTADGDILNFDGNEWTEMVLPDLNSITSIWGHSSSQVYATTLDGIILFFDGNSWSVESEGHAPLHNVWGTPEQDVLLATGSGGTLLRNVDGEWQPEKHTSSRGLFGIWGNSTDNLYVTGTSGTLLKFDGTNWREQNQFTTENIIDVWGSRNTVIAVGNFGLITEL